MWSSTIRTISTRGALAWAVISTSGYGAESAKPTTPIQPPQEQGPSKATVDKDYWDQPKNWYGAQPVSKFLPKGVVQARMIFQSGGGNKGFDNKGNKVSNGITAVGSGGALVLEYGITDSFGAQFIIPYVSNNKVGINHQSFRKSQAYQQRYQELRDVAAVALQNAGACVNREDCLSFVDEKSLPVTQELEYQGSKISVPGGTKITEALDSAIAQAAEPEDGELGIGDIQFGFGKNFISEGMFQFAVGAGFLAPTGKFEDVPAAKRPTGRGRWGIGIRTFTDIVLSDMFLVSWENQIEQDLGKGKRRKSELLNPDTLAEGSETYTRKGVRNHGDARIKVALGMLSRDLSFLGADLGIRYNHSAGETDSTGKEVSKANWIQHAYAGLNIDALRFRIPLRLDLTYQTPIAGKNQSVATAALGAVLKAYYRF